MDWKMDLLKKGWHRLYLAQKDESAYLSELYVKSFYKKHVNCLASKQLNIKSGIPKLHCQQPDMTATGPVSLLWPGQLYHSHAFFLTALEINTEKKKWCYLRKTRLCCFYLDHATDHVTICMMLIISLL